MEAGTPGYQAPIFLAVANARGQSAPKTTVARSGLEHTEQRDELLKTVYRMYCQHVQEEIDALVKERGFSPTWASQEGRVLLGPVYGRRGNEPQNPSFLHEAAADIRVMLVERDGKRTAVAPAEMAAEPIFWTVDSASYRSAERLIREVQADVSVSAIAEAFGGEALRLPGEPTVLGHRLTDAAFAKKEIDEIRIRPEIRRLDLRWVEKSEPPRWYGVSNRSFSDYVFGSYQILVANEDVAIDGRADYSGARTLGRLLLFPHTVLSVYLDELLEHFAHASTAESRAIMDAIQRLLTRLDLFGQPVDEIRRYSDSQIRERYFEPSEPGAREALDFTRSDMAERFYAALSGSGRVFDPGAWERNSES